MRESAFEAGFTDKANSKNLMITTEPEAAAIYCLENAKEYDLKVGDNYMVVDCGGGTVDLTVRKYIEKEKIEEMTARTGLPCGSTSVDDRFSETLDSPAFFGKYGSKPMANLREHNYTVYQAIVKRWCLDIKHLFKEKDLKKYDEVEGELDLNYFKHALKEYLDNKTVDSMDDRTWVLEFTRNQIENMFEPSLQAIIGLIDDQLQALKEPCKVIFLVGN